MATLREDYNNGVNSGVSTIQGAVWRAMTFTVGNTGSNVAFTPTHCVIYCIRWAAGSNAMAFDIYAVDGSGLPTGSALSTSTTDVTGWSDTVNAWNTASLGAVTLNPSTKYALVIHSPIASNGIRWVLDASPGTYTGGSYIASADSGATWAANTTYDFHFEIWGDDVSSGIQLDAQHIKFQLV